MQRRLTDKLVVKSLVVCVLAWATLALVADGIGYGVADRWTFWWATASLYLFFVPNPKAWRETA